MTKRCGKELFVEEYFGLIPVLTNEETKVVTNFGQLVNLLAMFEEEINESKKTIETMSNTTKGINWSSIIQNGKVRYSESKKLENGAKQERFKDLCKVHSIVSDFGHKLNQAIELI